MRTVDALVALVLAGYALIYLILWLSLLAQNGEVRTLPDTLWMALPVALAVGAFLGLVDTWRLSKDSATTVCWITPFLLTLAAVVFLGVWFLVAPNAADEPLTPLGLIALPGILAGWSAGRLGHAWLRNRGSQA